MNRRKVLVVASGLLIMAATAVTAYAQYGRQYYSGWTYYPSRSYYYNYYRYQPYAGYNGYNYHYCIYYPSRPRYIYYYNPHRGYYWGRFDLKGKGDNRYSLLAEKDRKAGLDNIPESAFPKPGKMPKIPEAKDNLAIAAPPAPPKTK